MAFKWHFWTTEVGSERPKLEAEKRLQKKSKKKIKRCIIGSGQNLGLNLKVITSHDVLFLLSCPLTQRGAAEPFLHLSPKYWTKETDRIKSALNKRNLQQIEMEARERKGEERVNKLKEKAKWCMNVKGTERKVLTECLSPFFCYY